MNEVELFIPGQVWTINRERSMHHMARASLVKPLRETAFALMHNYRRLHRFEYDVPVEVWFVPHQQMRGSVADTANHLPACKAVLDGCVDAGLVPDDSPQWVVSQKFYPPLKARETGVLIGFREAK